MKTITINKKGLYSYKILEEYESGVVLTGPEVKAAKLGQINLKGSYATIDQQNEPWLMNAHISAYKPAAGAQKDYDPTQRRKILLKHQEIKSLIGKLKIKGLTLLPIKVYTKKGLVKITLGLAQGKKMADKREIIKKREIDRKIAHSKKRHF